MFLNSPKNKQGSMLRRETQLPRNPVNKTTWFNPQHDNAMRDSGVKHVTLPLVLVEIDRKLGYVTRNNPTKREYSSSGHAHDAPNMLLNHRLYNLQKLDNNTRDTTASSRHSATLTAASSF